MDSFKSHLLSILFVLSMFSFSSSEIDPILQLAKWKWNYTSYETSLWSKDYQKTTLDAIYQQHEEFFEFDILEVDADQPVDSKFSEHIEEINRKWSSYRKWLKSKQYDVINDTARDTLARMLEIITDFPLNQNISKVSLDNYVAVRLYQILLFHWLIKLLQICNVLLNCSTDILEVSKRQ